MSSKIINREKLKEKMHLSHCTQQKLADYLNIGTDEIMAFGDSGNDATMLSVAKHSYAMISGNDKAKEVAKNITRLSNQESGVGDTINQYLTKL